MNAKRLETLIAKIGNDPEGTSCDPAWLEARYGAAPDLEPTQAERDAATVARMRARAKALGWGK